MSTAAVEAYKNRIPVYTVTDLVCILACASKLERSLYMLGDFAGIQAPIILLLNMMDVTEEQGRQIDAAKIRESRVLSSFPLWRPTGKTTISFTVL